MESIKYLSIKMVFISVFLFVFYPNTTLPLVGEPVPGAEVYIELEPDDEPIANVITNNDGEFMFAIPEGMILPKTGFFSITITPPKNLKGAKAKKLVGMQKQTIRLAFKKKDGPKFKYILSWEVNSKAENKGSFAVSGKNST